jgi:hypothetical protein
MNSGVRYRVIRTCSWSANGYEINTLTPGMILTSNDERVTPAFYGVALNAGWIEVIPTHQPERTTSIPTAPETRNEQPDELDKPRRGRPRKA